MTDKRPYWQMALAVSPLVPALLIPGVGALFSFAIVLIALALHKPARAPVLQWLDRGWARTAVLGIGGGIAIALAGEGIDWLTAQVLGLEIDLSNFDAVRGNLGNYLTLLAIGIGVGGVLEELTFGGFVIGWGTALLGERAKVWLVLLSAAIFGMAHMYQDWAGVIGTGLTGAMIGFLYLYAERKLLVPILAHSTVNIIGITMIYLGVQ